MFKKKLFNPRNSWTVKVDLPQGIDISYRYCVCSLVEIHEIKKFVVRRWETNLRPRKIACHGKLRILSSNNYVTSYRGNSTNTPANFYK